MKRTYVQGLDVLGGDGLFDMIPGLGMVGKLAGGGGAPPAGGATSTQEAVKKALAEEKAKQEAAKAAHDAATTKMLMYGILGVLGLGGAFAAVAYLRK